MEELNTKLEKMLSDHKAVVTEKELLRTKLNEAMDAEGRQTGWMN